MERIRSPDNSILWTEYHLRRKRLQRKKRRSLSLQRKEMQRSRNSSRGFFHIGDATYGIPALLFICLELLRTFNLWYSKAVVCKGLFQVN